MNFFRAKDYIGVSISLAIAFLLMAVEGFALDPQNLLTQFSRQVPNREHLLAYYPGTISDGKLLAKKPSANRAVQQVKGSGFVGAGSATVTGLLTTDTITATGDAPTCSVNGTLTFGTDFDGWDIYVHRAGVLWAYWPGINIGQTTELDASGNSHHLTALTTTTITERVDGTGTNHANSHGYSERDNWFTYSNVLSNAAWAKNGTATVEDVGDGWWKFSSGASDASMVGTLAGQGYTVDRFGITPNVGVYRALNSQPRRITYEITDANSQVWVFALEAYDDGHANNGRLELVAQERSDGRLQVGLQNKAGAYYFIRNLQLFKKDSPPNLGTVVCLGDSISSNYPTALATLYPTSTIVNAAVAGDTIAEMIDRFAADVAAENPDIIIIMAGANDIGDDRTLAQLQSDMLSLLALCDATGAEIIIQETTPRGERPGATAGQIAIQREYNTWLRTLGYTFVEQYDNMLEPGTTDSMCYAYALDDNLHPDEDAAYMYLAEAIATEAFGYTENNSYVDTTTAGIIGRQYGGFQSITDKSPQLGVDATVTVGTVFPDITITAPLGPKFQANATFGSEAAVDLSSFTATDSVRIGTKGLLIYDEDLSAADIIKADRYVKAVAVPPTASTIYITDSDGAYLTDSDGAYLTL